MWTQKEIAYLKDLKSKEQLCVEKNRKYAEQALDPALKGLFERIGQVEQRHVQVVEGMLNGTLPQQNAAGAQQNPQAPMQATYSQAPNPAKQQDAYLCQDALGMEKLVLSAMPPPSSRIWGRTKRTRNMERMVPRPRL